MVETLVLSLITDLLQTLSQLPVNSKPDHPPGDPGDPHVFTALAGIGFSPSLLCPEGSGFELEKFPAVLKEKCRNFSICFKETGPVWKAGVVSYQFFAKTIDVYCILINIDHFRPFRSF